MQCRSKAIRNPGHALRTRVVLFAAFALISGSASCGSPPARAASPQVFRLWPGQAPGTESWTGAEEAADAQLPNLGKVHVITNVTVPTLTIFRPAKPNGSAMVVVPGGAFRALPWDLDGLETAHWLTDHGITAFVLKYRVRPPGPEAAADRSFDDFAHRTEGARAIAVADAEQAIRIVRSRARQFAISPDRVGMIGFSAGAMATALVADASDPAVRPNFAVSLYGAWLAASEPSANAAPLFIVAAQDDPEAPVLRSVDLFQRWTKANRPAELHVYERGGHGFAFRRHNLPADRWPGALQAWLGSRGYLPAKR